MMWANPSRALALTSAINQLAGALAILPFAVAGCGGAVMQRWAYRMAKA